MHIAKAVVGALIAGLTALSAVLVDGGSVSPAEWVTVVLAALSTLGVVYAVPNTEAAPPYSPDPPPFVG